MDLNAKETKVMQSSIKCKANLKVDSVDKEEVDSYVHLSREVNMFHSQSSTLKAPPSCLDECTTFEGGARIKINCFFQLTCD